ncbi:MAG TPA: pyruvate dehydrogenase (acetyl-transferring), homodimeric type [Gammaproteobacteria bacterium]|nr:pyruvate dehydrogenase (acetyl-transferring), homodimeric type [Gammaproteobacteria bacterium]
MSDSNLKDSTDIDIQETREWQESIRSVLANEGPERAKFLLENVILDARRTGAYIPYDPSTPYINTIPPHQEKKMPGEQRLERQVRSLIRWNAMAMVVRAKRSGKGLGGHIASYQSAATLYEVGFNHFFHAPSEGHGGDLLYLQGHSSEGIYSRAFLEGRLSEENLKNFRQETHGKGISSYPHPWLMPDFWQFATVSMGLGPITAIYQARFMKYLENRGIAKTSNRKVWCFIGDGETDEPETLGAIDIAAREKLDNLIFVINCNLQRLDGPVRGDSKIVQELEGRFHGAGWNVIKVLWGGRWDQLLAQDEKGLLLKRMEECVDGEYQSFKAHGGAYTREHFFGKYPELKEMVANYTDEDIWHLNRGGHDPQKVYAAYAAAVEHKGQPTVILAKTIKGYGMGEAGEAAMTAHQSEEMNDEQILAFRDRFEIPLSDEEALKLPFIRPDEGSEVMRYLKERRKDLGGYLPARREKSTTLQIPDLEAFRKLLDGSGDREISTTMVYVRILQILTRDKNIRDHIVPIVPDEARTFGMEGLFRSIGIYAPEGQLYNPVDAGQLAFYREDVKGQILEEGITEAGSMSSFIAAGTAYSTHDTPMIPFFSFYSMFGFQRFGDLCWAAGDMRSRGFLLGGTSGRTTMNGEGLQHEDGQSHLFFSVIPNVRTYDPTFAYEFVVIVQDGLRRMYVDQEDCYYYITMMNENYVHPPMPEGVEDGIIRGMYLFRQDDSGKKQPRVQLMGSGTILREVIAAAELLKQDWNVAADIWSAPGINELARDGRDTERWNRLHPEQQPKQAYVTECLGGREGPVVVATDYVRSYSEQIRPFVPQRYCTLGTDGYGRSDTRENLREFFEVSRHWIAVTALSALADEGKIDRKKVAEAIKKYDIDPDKPNPLTV